MSVGIPNLTHEDLTAAHWGRVATERGRRAQTMLMKATAIEINIDGIRHTGKRSYKDPPRFRSFRK